MTSELGPRLSSEPLGALKFAAHRQLSRWAKHQPLRARQQARRDALLPAVRALADDTLCNGCHLRPIRGDRDG
jgi:hypothetical protein